MKKFVVKLGLSRKSILQKIDFGKGVGLATADRSLQP
jgi:hypothetical protein